jgi:hypothetical protein
MLFSKKGIASGLELDSESGYKEAIVKSSETREEWVAKREG